MKKLTHNRLNFFFKAEDDIRDPLVTGVQTCALPISPTTTFKQQAQLWLDEMRAGRIVSRRKRKPIKPATLAGYEAAVNWLNQIIGETPLVDIKKIGRASCRKRSEISRVERCVEM